MGAREGWRDAGEGGVLPVPAFGCMIPDFCFLTPEMQFEPIKSMVSGWFRGRSGGGRAESMRNFESGGLAKLRIPLTVSA